MTESLFDLTGKTAIITGGGGLLGVEHGRALGKHGTNVVLVDIDLENCKSKAEELKKESINAIAVKGDVSSEKDWNNILETVTAEFDSADILVNNASFTNQTRSENYGMDFTETPLEDWNNILDVNLTGTFLGCKVIGKHMVSKGSGSIINIASLYGVVSPNHRIYDGTGVLQPAAYSVSKSAVLGLTRYLGALWGEKGVRVNAITPGGIFDDHKDPFASRYKQLSPMGRMADKSEMQGGVVFLASEASSHCCGHNLVIDGGWTIW